MKQYSIKVGRTVMPMELTSRKEAERFLKRMGEADRAYDIPDPEKRVVVERDVSPWRVSKKEG